MILCRVKKKGNFYFYVGLLLKFPRQVYLQRKMWKLFDSLEYSSLIVYFLSSFNKLFFAHLTDIDDCNRQKKLFQLRIRKKKLKNEKNVKNESFFCMSLYSAPCLCWWKMFLVVFLSVKIFVFLLLALNHSFLCCATHPHSPHSSIFFSDDEEKCEKLEQQQREMRMRLALIFNLRNTKNSSLKNG